MKTLCCVSKGPFSVSFRYIIFLRDKWLKVTRFMPTKVSESNSAFEFEYKTGLLCRKLQKAQDKQPFHEFLRIRCSRSIIFLRLRRLYFNPNAGIISKHRADTRLPCFNPLPMLFSDSILSSAALIVAANGVWCHFTVPWLTSLIIEWLKNWHRAAVSTLR